MQTLIRAVSRLERRWSVWDREMARAEKAPRASTENAADDIAEDEMLVVDGVHGTSNTREDVHHFAHLHAPSSPSK